MKRLIVFLAALIVLTIIVVKYFDYSNIIESYIDSATKQEANRN